MPFSSYTTQTYLPHLARFGNRAHIDHFFTAVRIYFSLFYKSSKIYFRRKKNINGTYSTVFRDSGVLLGVRACLSLYPHTKCNSFFLSKGMNISPMGKLLLSFYLSRDVRFSGGFVSEI